MTTPIEILEACTVESDSVVISGTRQSVYVLRLPDRHLSRDLYLEFAKKLELIGGKWNRKLKGFMFTLDPTELLEELKTVKQRNLKKEFQFFATPKELAKQLVELALIMEGDRILEPSCGQGAIVEAINQHCDILPECYELMDINIKVLEQRVHRDEIRIKHVGDDFLKHNPYSDGFSEGKFDRIIANPPFAKNADIDHITHMYNCLNDGGRLVSVASKSWQLGSSAKQRNFKQWLEDLDAEIIELPRGTFKESGTEVAAVIIIIDK